MEPVRRLRARSGGRCAARATGLAGGASLGVVTTLFLAEPRGERRRHGRVLLPATWLPLILYLAVFVARFACGAWAAIRPDQALVATAVATAISAAMTARLIAAVARWRYSDG